MRVLWRPGVAAAAAALMLASLSACGNGSSSSATEGGSGTTTVRLALSSPNSSSWDALAVGIHEGLFAKEGIKIELQVPGGSANVMQSMAAGRTDIGAPTPETAMAAIDKGQDAKLVYEWTRGPVNSIAVQADSPIKDFQGLEGKKVGVQTLASGAAVQVQSVMADLGMPKDSVKLVAVDTGASAWDALRRGRVDALALWDTEYAGMELQGADLRLIQPSQLEPLFSTTFVATGDFIKKHPDLMGAFGKVWAESTVWANANPDAAIRDMWAEYPETKTSGDGASLLEQQKKVWEARNEVVLKGDPETNKTWGKYDESSIQNWLDFLKSAGTVSDKLTADQVYTNQFADQYNDFDPAQIRALAKKAS